MKTPPKQQRVRNGCSTVECLNVQTPGNSTSSFIGSHEREAFGSMPAVADLVQVVSTTPCRPVWTRSMTWRSSQPADNFARNKSRLEYVPGKHERFAPGNYARNSMRHPKSFCLLVPFYCTRQHFPIVPKRYCSREIQLLSLDGRSALELETMG